MGAPGGVGALGGRAPACESGAVLSVAHRRPVLLRFVELGRHCVADGQLNPLLA